MVDDGIFENPVNERFDVLIVGSGLSGIAAAYHLRKRSPNKRFAILEARDAIGGTWDLFHYPGVRSDSDMHTLGYTFRPWKDATAITGGGAILRYIQDTAAEYCIDRTIRFGQRVESASWSSANGEWIVDATAGAERRSVRYACTFLFACCGYYDYDAGYLPEWPRREDFEGVLVHPQQWPDELAYAGRNVAVIGSGATAVTLVPELAKTAAHVTLLQRSPTYIISRSARDAIAGWLQRVLPGRLAYALIRWKNVLLSTMFLVLAKYKPAVVKRLIARRVRKRLGANDDVERHFTPRYNPWDQRLCLVPDADLFDAIRSGSVTVVTDEIENFTPTGVHLRSGTAIDADVIVAATGLTIKVIGGIRLVVDGTPADIAKTMHYKTMMFSDVPNFASAFGYVNASWTLKTELISIYVCRLLNYMDARGYTYCVPRRRDPKLFAFEGIGLTSGYVLRSLHLLPKQGSRRPWKLLNLYIFDLLALRFGPLRDAAMDFVRVASATRAA